MKEVQNKKIKFRPSLLVALGIILALTMGAQLTFLSVFGTRGKEVANIRKRQKELILENELLEASINKKQSLLYVKKVATKELGMVQIQDIEYITPNKTVGENPK